MYNETSDDRTCDIEFLGDSTVDKKMYDHAATNMNKDLALIPTASNPQNLDQPNDYVLSKKDTWNTLSQVLRRNCPNDEVSR